MVPGELVRGVAIWTSLSVSGLMALKSVWKLWKLRVSIVEVLLLAKELALLLLMQCMRHDLLTGTTTVKSRHASLSEISRTWPTPRIDTRLRSAHRVLRTIPPIVHLAGGRVSFGSMHSTVMDSGVLVSF